MKAVNLKCSFKREEEGRGGLCLHCRIHMEKKIIKEEKKKKDCHHRAPEGSGERVK